MFPKRSSAWLRRCARLCSVTRSMIGLIRTVDLAVVAARTVAAVDLIDGVHRCGSGRRSGLGLR